MVSPDTQMAKPIKGRNIKKKKKTILLCFVFSCIKKDPNIKIRKGRIRDILVGVRK